MQSILLEDSLRHIIFNMTTLSSIDTSINRFSRITTLNLSNNQINSIEGPIVLPLLQRLDISNNKLKSLDFLQQLVQLKSLNVASNNIASLKSSIYMLIPLTGSITTFDMSGNTVCSDLRYADEVLHIFPRLQYFDGTDIASMFTPTYSHSSQGQSSPSRGGMPSPRTSLNSPKINSNVSKPPPLPHEANRDMKSISFGTTQDRSYDLNDRDNKDVDKSNSGRKDKDFEVRLRRAIKRQKAEEKRFASYNINTSERVPLYDKSINRIRESFEKLSTRGTFERSSKGLSAEWYPMDYDDVEAIRRQGYFHEVIGGIQKYSYQDFRNREDGGNGNDENSVNCSLTDSSINGSSKFFNFHFNRIYIINDLFYF
jgi:hypothetical protein